MIASHLFYFISMTKLSVGKLIKDSTYYGNSNAIGQHLVLDYVTDPVSYFRLTKIRLWSSLRGSVSSLFLRDWIISSLSVDKGAAE